jgi:hypothetical protein
LLKGERRMEELEPIRNEITALAYLIWTKKEDLPKDIEDSIDDIMELIKDTI